MTDPGQARRRWTSGEDEELQLLLDAGKIAPEIALTLNRTTQAIYARLQRLYRKRTVGRRVPQHGKQWGLKAKGK